MIYMDIVNAVLGDSNEIPLDVGSWTKGRGIQNSVKGFVNRAYFDLLNESVEWPWMIRGNEVAGIQSDTIAALAQWTIMGVFSNNIDWDSFSYVNDEGKYTQLTYMDWDEWHTKRQADDAEDSVGNQPKYVIQGSDGLTYGISPKPKEAGTIKYRTFNSPTLLVNLDDKIIIPDQYYNVLVTKATAYLWAFKSNSKQADASKADYKRMVRQMMGAVSDKRSSKMRL